MLDARFLDKLACPETGRRLEPRDGGLATQDGARFYPVSAKGVPLFALEICSPDATQQRDHYDRVAAQYVSNLGYPHTQEYTAYLDRAFLKHVQDSDLGAVAEICCGKGELADLLGPRIGLGIGVDVSPAMLDAAKDKHGDPGNMVFVQGDATRLPLADGGFDSVFLLGGIHHVPDRAALFKEVFRILKPGGRLFFREPVSDFFLWRWIRSVVYRISPALDADTERPLTWDETVPVLKAAGLDLQVWETHGFLGFCVFMNSDVLVFNRLFRFVPGIRAVTRAAVRLDELTRALPFLERAGTQVIGVARKPGSASA